MSSQDLEIQRSWIFRGQGDETLFPSMSQKLTEAKTEHIWVGTRLRPLSKAEKIRRETISLTALNSK